MVRKKIVKEKKNSVIAEVKVLNNYKLRITFTHGSILVLDMKSRLGTIRYYPLNDLGILHSAYTDGTKIIFDTKPKYELDIFPQEAMEMALTPSHDGKIILRAETLGKHKVYIDFASGSSMELDMKNHFEDVNCSILKDRELLHTMSTDGENLIFGEDLKINIRELVFPMVGNWKENK